MGRGQFIDLTGQRFGRWVAMQKSGYGTTGARWICRCDCGTIKEVASLALRSGSSKSCGCYAKDYQRERIAREGWAAKPSTGATYHVVEKDGRKMTLAEWSKETGIALSVLVNRWNRGWTNDQLLEPTRNQLIEQFKAPDPLFDPNKKVEEQ